MKRGKCISGQPNACRQRTQLPISRSRVVQIAEAGHMLLASEPGTVLAPLATAPVVAASRGGMQWTSG
jgi:hypothetical protein